MTPLETGSTAERWSTPQSGGILDLGNSSSTWSSTGPIGADAATINFNGTWLQTEEIVATTAAVLNLNGSYTIPPADLITTSSGTVNLFGIMKNAGNKLTLDATTGSWNLFGEIQGGTVKLTPGIQISVPQGGKLDDVDLAGDLDLTGGTLTVVDGLTLDDTLSINGPAYVVTSLNFSGNQTISGNGKIVFGSEDIRGAPSDQIDISTSDTTVTFGPELTIDGQSGSDHDFGSQLCTMSIRARSQRTAGGIFIEGVAMDQQRYVRGG